MIDLILSSIASGVIATVAMLAAVYLPLVWRGAPCDVVGMLGSSLTGREDARSRYLGTVLLTVGGVLFTFLYGLLIATLMGAGSAMPSLPLRTALPTSIDLAYPLVGVAMGVAHGGVIALLMTILVTEHHPIARFRDGFSFIVPLVAGHLAFGATAGFFVTSAAAAAGRLTDTRRSHAPPP